MLIKNTVYELMIRTPGSLEAPVTQLFNSYEDAKKSMENDIQETLECKGEYSENDLEYHDCGYTTVKTKDGKLIWEIEEKEIN